MAAIWTNYSKIFTLIPILNNNAYTYNKSLVQMNKKFPCWLTLFPAIICFPVIKFILRLRYVKLQ